MEIRTVGGRRYNRDTAKKVGTSADATLYRKKNGEFFLHREGDNKIESLIFRDARKWAKKNLTEEEFLSAFEYSDSKQQVLYSLPQYAIEKLRTMAGDRRVSASQLITDLIMGAIDDDNEEVKKLDYERPLKEFEGKCKELSKELTGLIDKEIEGKHKELTGLIDKEIDRINTSLEAVEVARVAEKPDPIRNRLIDAKEGAKYCGVSVPTFKKWADEIGATRRIRKFLRYDLTAIDEALNK